MPNRITDATLRKVARVYTKALTAGGAPTDAVAAALDVPRSTAGRWVTKARDRGILTLIDPRASNLKKLPHCGTCQCNGDYRA